MKSEILFVTTNIVTCVAVMLICFKCDIKKMTQYFKTKDGKGVLKGIVLAILASVFFVVLSSGAVGEEKGEWFAYGEVYFGLDQTFGRSPQCHTGGVSDKLTSNIGFKANIYRPANKRFEANIKYTHHSCALSPDRNGYDAIGVEYTYRIWGS